MASIGDSIRKSIADWELGELDFAMLNACNALDGTAKKLHPSLGSNARFTQTLRDRYGIFGPMAAPGIDIINTRWPVKLAKPKATGGQPDIADVIYGIHRCSHGHGEELPDGFTLLQDAAGPDGITRIAVQEGKVQLSDRVIFGLLAVAVLSPVNIGQTVPDSYFLSFEGQRFPINQWWGREVDFLAITSAVSLPNVQLDFDDWMIGI